MIKIEHPDSTKLDEIKQWDTWEKEPCTFDHDQQKTESFYILEGSATLNTETDSDVKIAPGDLVTVDKDQIVNWQVHEAVRKHYIFFD